MKYLDLLRKYGSKRAVARAIGVDESTIRRRIEKEMKEDSPRAHTEIRGTDSLQSNGNRRRRYRELKQFPFPLLPPNQ